MESRPPPNLSDPEELAAYRRELRSIARGVRFGGVAITVFGAALALLRAELWPTVPVPVPAVAIAIGVVLTIKGIMLRTAYHRQRMQG